MSIAMKEARERLFSLRGLIKLGMGTQLLKRFYSCTIESILTVCITAWYGNSTALDCMELQRVVWTAQYITGPELPAIQDFYIRLYERKDRKIV